MVTIICVKTSGGVMIAAINNTTTIECFRYFFKKSDVRMPIFVKIRMNTGSKKMTPVKIIVDIMVEMKSLMIKSFFAFSVNKKLPRKFTVSGAMT